MLESSEPHRHLEAEEGNRRHWDELAGVHALSYDISGLLEGRCQLDSIQREELGDLDGRSLLHLQSHIGTDTLSLALLGARVTGVDISSESVSQARRLSQITGISGRFIQSSLYDLPEALDESFDVVYTSVGVLCWLSDLKSWARLIRRYLKPGGTFYIMESHPVLMAFDDETPDVRLRYEYFHRGEPTRWAGGYQDYDDGDYTVESPSWEWQWSLGDVVSALAGAGLLVRFLHEHPVIHWKALPCMVEREGWFRMPTELDGKLPLSFSLLAGVGA